MNKQVKYQFLPLKNFVAVLLMIGILHSIPSVAKAQQSLSVIANKKGSPAAISRNQLTSVFMGEKQRWSNGIKIQLALIKTNNPLGVSISSQVFDMTPDELNKYFLALVFQGKLSAPLFFNSTAELHEFVAKHPGAIGITNENVNTAEINTLVVDGKSTL